MASPPVLTPSTIAEVLAEQDALKASNTFRRLPSKELPNFLLTLTTKIVSSPIDQSKLHSRNTAIRQSYYSAVTRTAKTESSLLILAIKYDKLTTLNSNALRIEYVTRLSNLVMIFMGKYSTILKDVPKSDIISNKLGKDVYFHLIKRLPSLITLIEDTDPAVSLQALTDAVYYIKSSVMHPLSRFISLLLGELSSAGHRPDIDKREFKREQAADKKNLKEDFKKNKKFYKTKWSALRNEAFATLSNLDIESSVSSNSAKTRDVLNERRARIDNFIYSLEQGIQAINSNNFEGFVSAKVAIEDSLIEYSKRLEFRTLAKKSRDIDEAFNIKAKKKADNAAAYYKSMSESKDKKSGTGSSLDSKVHSVLKHLGPAGLAAYATYKLINNPITKAIINNPITRTLIGRPLRYLGGKAVDGLSFAVSSAASLAGRGLLSGLRLAGKGLGIVGRAAGSASVRGAKSVSASIGQLYTKATSAQAKQSLVRLADRAMYGTGYGAGKAVRAAKNASGLLSKLLNSKSTSGTLASAPTRTEPDTSGLFDSDSSIPSAPPDKKQSGFPLELLTGQTQLPTLNSGRLKTGFPLSLISGPTPLPRMNSGLNSPRADLFIDDVLERIDEHVPYLPADLTEEDFTLEDLKDAVEDALENFLTGTKSNKLTPKLSDIVAEKSSNSLVSVPVSASESKIQHAESSTERPAEALETSPVPKTSSKPKPLEEFKSSIQKPKVTDTRLVELASASTSIYTQLVSIDKRLDELLSERAKLNPYSGSTITEIRAFIKEHRVFDYNAKPTKTEDEIIEEETSKREERADRSELIRAVQNLSKSRSGQTGGFNVASLAAFAPLVSKASSLIGTVMGGKSGALIKSVLPSVLKYAPRLASFALPALAIGATAYAAWEAGSAVYDEYATQILDTIDGVINLATDIVDGISSGYEALVSFIKNPSEKLREAGTKLSKWWSKSPIKTVLGNFVDSTKVTTGSIANRVESVGSTVTSNIRSATSPIVDKVQNTASGAKNYVSSTVGKLFTTNKASVDFDNLDPGTKSSFEAMAHEYRSMGGTKPLSIESARRTTEEQARLYAENPTKAARPGRSLHEHGRALDIDRATAGELESMGLLSKYGFARNVKGEPWHISHTGQSPGGLPQSVTSHVVPATGQQSSQTKTVNQTSPTSVAPSYTLPPAKVSVPTPAPVVQMPAPQRGSDPINTFSFLDSSFFVLNAGMMAS